MSVGIFEQLSSNKVGVSCSIHSTG